MKTKVRYIALFLFPSLIVIGVIYYMLGWTTIASTMNWVGMAPKWDFAGILNYKILFSSPRFWNALKNNILWLAFFVLPASIVGLVLAYSFELVPRFSKILRPIFLYPLVIAPIVTGTVWAWIFDPQMGIMNSISSIFDLHFGWIADPNMANYCLIIAGIWQNLGFALVLYLAAIGEIPREQVEAARVDGASYWSIFFFIVIPEIGHAMIIVLSLLTLYSLKVFDLVWVMTRGGPGYSTEVLPYLMYRLTFRQLMVGEGAAVSIIILALSMIVLIPLSKWIMQRWMS